jgi:hypothetical protein
MVYPALQDCILFQQLEKERRKKEKNIVGTVLIKQ